ncbi:glycoside hydrolase family 78 protein [Sesbania bispinosa]|nr:glycoside hydrolase family 78 protein [Sesbania bispinosa]
MKSKRVREGQLEEVRKKGSSKRCVRGATRRGIDKGQLEEVVARMKSRYGKLSLESIQSFSVPRRGVEM